MNELSIDMRHGFAAIACIVAANVAFCAGCSPGSSKNHESAAQATGFLNDLAKVESSASRLQLDEGIEQRIHAFCGDCHAVPDPGLFERHVWYQEVKKGYEFYAQSGRLDLDPPPLEQVVRYYRQKSEPIMRFNDLGEIDQGWLDRFRIDKIDWKDGNYIIPGVSSIQWLDLMAPGKFDLVVCDMRDGSVNLVDLKSSPATRRVLARIGNPARTTLVDVDDDGLRDLLVADLGSVNPFDHTFGQVVWLRRVPDSQSFERRTVIGGRGRIADVFLGDFGDESSKELVIAEFGHREAGGIHRLQGDWQSMGADQRNLYTIDPRPGTIRVVPHDWDGDDRLDFAALVSQQFESVELFLNRNSNFARRVIWRADNLGFGSTDIEPVDLDGDGDMDIVYTNGDSFDNNFANCSHGVHWLENRGNLQFDCHRLIDLPGAYRTRAGDFDSDGDLDLVCVANLPQNVEPQSLKDSNPVSVLVLEQRSDKQFAPRVMARGSPRYPALEVADFDGNGKLDFAVGTLLFELVGSKALPRLAIWWQR